MVLTPRKRSANDEWGTLASSSTHHDAVFGDSPFPSDSSSPFGSDVQVISTPAAAPSDSFASFGPSRYGSDATGAIPDSFNDFGSFGSFSASKAEPTPAAQKPKSEPKKPNGAASGIIFN